MDEKKRNIRFVEDRNRAQVFERVHDWYCMSARPAKPGSASVRAIFAAGLRMRRPNTPVSSWSSAPEHGIAICELKSRYNDEIYLDALQTIDTSDAVRVIRWNSRNRNRIAAGVSSRPIVYDTEYGKETVKLLKHPDVVSDIAWCGTEESCFLSCCSKSAELRYWDLRSPKKADIKIGLTNFAPPASHIAFRPGTSRLFVSGHGGELFFWDMRNFFTPIEAIHAHYDLITSLEWETVNVAEDQWAENFRPTNEGVSGNGIAGQGASGAGVASVGSGKYDVVLTASCDRTVKFWPIPSNLETFTRDSIIEGWIPTIERNKEVKKVTFQPCEENSMAVLDVDSSEMNMYTILCSDGRPLPCQTECQTLICSNSETLTETAPASASAYSEAGKQRSRRRTHVVDFINIQEANSRIANVTLMASVANPKHPVYDIGFVMSPAKRFLSREEARGKQDMESDSQSSEKYSSSGEIDGNHSQLPDYLLKEVNEMVKTGIQGAESIEWNIESPPVPGGSAVLKFDIIHTYAGVSSCYTFRLIFPASVPRVTPILYDSSESLLSTNENGEQVQIAQSSVIVTNSANEVLGETDYEKISLATLLGNMIERITQRKEAIVDHKDRGRVGSEKKGQAARLVKEISRILAGSEGETPRVISKGSPYNYSPLSQLTPRDGPTNVFLDEVQEMEDLEDFDSEEEENSSLSFLWHSRGGNYVLHATADRGTSELLNFVRNHLPSFLEKRVAVSSTFSVGSNIPAPRLSGGLFCSTGKLLFFTNESFLNNLSIQQAHPANYKQYLEEVRTLPTERFDRESSHSQSFVVIQDVEALFPWRKALAEEYSLDFAAERSAATFAHNVALCERMGFSYKAKVWRIVQVLREQLLQAVRNFFRNKMADPFLSQFDAPLFGLPVLKRLLLELAAQGDVQMLAMVALALDIDPDLVMYGTVGEPTSASRLQPKVGTGSESSASTTQSQLFSMDTGSWFSIIRRFKKPKVDEIVTSAPESSQGSESGSSKPIFDLRGSKVFRTPARIDARAKFDRRALQRLLAPTFRNELLRMGSEFYAEMLRMWGMDNDSARMLKKDAEAFFGGRQRRDSVLYNPDDHHREGIVGPERFHFHFESYCKMCKRSSSLSTDGSRCLRCGSRVLACSLCNLPMDGQFLFCYACGHGGHPQHMKKWFEKFPTCPAGCGCECLRYISMNQ